MAEEGVDQLPVASKRLSDSTKVPGYPESQSHPKTRVESLGGVGGEGENGNEDEKEREWGVAAVGEAAVFLAVAEERSGCVSEKNAKQVAKQD